MTSRSPNLNASDSVNPKSTSVCGNEMLLKQSKAYLY